MTVAAAWVGIVAGVVFIVAVIFFSGFILGAHSGGHRGGPGGHKGDDGFAVIHRGPPPMFPMGPPRGEFGPGPGSGPFGPGGPRFEPPQPGQPQSPGSTTTPCAPLATTNPRFAGELREQTCKTWILQPSAMFRTTPLRGTLLDEAQPIGLINLVEEMTPDDR